MSIREATGTSQICDMINLDPPRFVSIVLTQPYLLISLLQTNHDKGNATKRDTLTNSQPKNKNLYNPNSKTKISFLLTFLLFVSSLYKADAVIV